VEGFSVLSLLLPIRKNSKMFGKFMITYMTKTVDFDNTELILLAHPEDDWNRDYFEYFENYIKIIPDKTGLGRGSCNIFYDMLAKKARGDWLWYMCEDHNLPFGYDEYIASFIASKGLNASKPNVVIPTVSNSGRISHIISRGWFDTIGFGNRGNVDSYINDTLTELDSLTPVENNVYHIAPEPILYDFSMEKDLMTRKEGGPFDNEYEKALYKSQATKDLIKEDAKKIWLKLQS
jgi:hypothetical protein